MNKDPIASAVMAAASKVREHHVQRLEQAFRGPRSVASEAQGSRRQVVGDAQEMPSDADRTQRAIA